MKNGLIYPSSLVSLVLVNQASFYQNSSPNQVCMCFEVDGSLWLFSTSF